VLTKHNHIPHASRQLVQEIPTKQVNSYFAQMLAGAFSQTSRLGKPWIICWLLKPKQKHHQEVLQCLKLIA